MTKLLYRTITLLALVLFLTNCSDKEITCVIKGKIIGRNSDTLVLQKATDDIRFAQIMIPIKDSTFEYKLVIPQTEAYVLVFQDELKSGAWRPIYLFPENGAIDCKLYSFKDYEKNQINGGTFNKEYSNYRNTFEETFKPKYQPINDSMSALRNRNEFYSEEMLSLQKEMQNAKNSEARMNIAKKFDDLRTSGNDLSSKGKELNNKMELMRLEANQWRYKYIEQNPSLLTYYFLLEDIKSIKYNKINIDDIKKNYTSFSIKFPNHPYTKLINSILEGQESIKVGGKFIDFSVPDLDGKIHKLSEVIVGKIALIDLWASWCGPCIMTSRSMIPVYEEFNKKGFTICGVAAEIKDSEQMKKTIEKEKFPWINLVELDHKNQIWDKYGISNAGGGTFLVDKDGTILALNPTADEVRNILIDKLK